MMKRAVLPLILLLGMYGQYCPGAVQADATNSTTSANDALINVLIRKGVLTEKEAEGIKAEASRSQSTGIPASTGSTWSLPSAIKNVTLFGDARLRYEYRSADNPAGLQSPASPRERFRYALRLGIKGDVTEDFSFGFRLETGTNPRSTWVTFGGDNTSGTPSGKASAGIYVGQLYMNWHPAKWVEVTFGKMPMPLYTTTMLWDNDICPEGAFEKLNADIGNVNLFVDMGQFDYENPASTSMIPSGDVFLLAWQAGATVNFQKGMFAKIAPLVYTYSGGGSSLSSSPQSQLAGVYTGQGSNGVNVLTASKTFDEYGINNLMILEIPAEFDFPIRNTPLGNLEGRLFGDFAWNVDGEDRARTAASAAGLSGAFTHEVKAYQVGMGVGSDLTGYGPMQGVVYGNLSRKHAWEARVYWQHVEQYALDVNLLDSDFFEGRANLEGVYGAFAYGFSDALTGTIRYGYAHRINHALGTGGNNSDLSIPNPVNNFRELQLDLAVRF